jgi:hypothetical protein
VFPEFSKISIRRFLGVQSNQFFFISITQIFLNIFHRLTPQTFGNVHFVNNVRNKFVGLLYTVVNKSYDMINGDWVNMCLFSVFLLGFK